MFLILRSSPRLAFIKFIAWHSFIQKVNMDIFCNEQFLSDFRFWLSVNKSYGSELVHILLNW